MSTPTVTCDLFDHLADDLALGALDQAERDHLLTHARTCPRCGALLDGLDTVVGQLLLLAPEVDPPAGFESRVLARLDAPADAGGAGRRQPSRLLLAAAAAVAVLALVGATALVTRSVAGSPPSAELVGSAAVAFGEVQLVTDPQPHVLVVIDNPRPYPGTHHCELQQADGTWVEVGAWQSSDVTGGAWAAGIDAALLDARAMRITTDDGTVVASASFSPLF